MHREVHATELQGVRHLLDAVDADLAGRRPMVTTDELRRMHKHAARAAGGIKNGAVIRLDDLDDQLDDGRRRKELTALLHIVRAQLPHEVLEDETVGITFDLQRREQTQQLLQYAVRQSRVT